MGSKPPSWVGLGQWGTGRSSFGGDEDGDMLMSKKANSDGGKKMAEVKAAASAVFDKAKAAAAVGAQKVDSGTSVGIKWVQK